MPFDTAAMTRTAAAARTRPWSLMLTAAIVVLQGIAIFALGGLLEWGAFFADPESRVNAFLMGILCLIGGAGLMLCGSGLWRLRRWSRSPALVWQLLVIPVGAYQLQSSLRLGGIVIIATAVIAALPLLLPRTVRALAD